jgi:hypothetical protein
MVRKQIHLVKKYQLTNPGTMRIPNLFNPIRLEMTMLNNCHLIFLQIKPKQKDAIARNLYVRRNIVNAIMGEKDVLKTVLVNHVRISIIALCWLKKRDNQIKNLKIKDVTVERVLAGKITAFALLKGNNAHQVADAATAKIVKQNKKKTSPCPIKAAAK